MTAAPDKSNVFAVNFADFILRQQGSNDPDLRLAARLLAEADFQQEVAVDLNAVNWSVPDIAAKLLAFSRVVSDSDATPLVLSGGRLYLQRYFTAEKLLAGALAARTGRRDDFEPAAAGGLVRQLLPEPGDPHQRLALFAALRSRLTIISGGPGTGKTFVAARILKGLRALYGEKQDIRLAAPTGKAAARLTESLAAAGFHPGDRSASTIHRLLRPGYDGDFRHHRGNPIAADVVLLDEVSMVPLQLLARLLDALAPSVSVILLGDRHQLSSVEPGCVFADLCRAAEGASFSREFAGDFQLAFGQPLPADLSSGRFPELDDSAVELRHSRRFRSDGAIASVSRRLNAATTEAEAEEILNRIEEGGADLTALPLPAPPLSSGRTAARNFRIAIREGYRPLLEADSPAAAFAALAAFRILSATRVGPFGSEAINHLARQLLFPGHDSRSFYRGKPVIILENDYQLNLFNGDIGILLPAADGRLLAHFPDPAGPESYRQIPPGLLPPHEEVFAMTVHKSQGSEFDRVLLLMPETGEFIGRELFYTGLTRARHGVRLFHRREELKKIILRQTRRTSGLAERLRAFSQS